MLIAEAAGYEVYGIEYEEATCKIARDLIWKFRTVKGNKKNDSIIRDDITTFEHYADYDVIYYYSPISERNKAKQFLKKLGNNAKVGSIVISYGGGGSYGPYYFANDVRFKILPKTCWAYQKISK